MRIIALILVLAIACATSPCAAQINNVQPECAWNPNTFIDTAWDWSTTAGFGFVSSTPSLIDGRCFDFNDLSVIWHYNCLPGTEVMARIIGDWHCDGIDPQLCDEYVYGYHITGAAAPGGEHIGQQLFTTTAGSDGAPMLWFEADTEVLCQSIWMFEFTNECECLQEIDTDEERFPPVFQGTTTNVVVLEDGTIVNQTINHYRRRTPRPNSELRRVCLVLADVIVSYAVRNNWECWDPPQDDITVEQDLDD